MKRIVEYVNVHPKCTRRKLVEALSPPPPPAPFEASRDAVAGANASAPAQPEAVEPTPEQTAVIADLHWLIHQGHVIEFANGILETAKKPYQTGEASPKPEPKPVEQTAQAAPAAEPWAVLDLSEEQPANPETIHPLLPPEPEASNGGSSVANPPADEVDAPDQPLPSAASSSKHSLVEV